jgi:hypothetical protein
MNGVDEEDQAAEYAAAWSVFERLEGLSDHRSDWGDWVAGRGPHLLLMALIRDSATVEAIQAVQHALNGPRDVELHAAHFFHISIQSFGFGRLADLDAGLPHRLEHELCKVPGFDVVLGGANAFHSVVFLETHSGGRLFDVRRAARTAAGPMIGEIDPYPGFLFHLTIGHFGAAADAAEIRETIRPLRGVGMAVTHIEEIALVEVPTDQRVPFPRLEPLHTFRLA